MADNFLSQEEVDALLKGVNGDQDDVAAPEEASGVRTYNLATQERIVRGRMPTLEIINERFARYLRIGLFKFIRRSAEASVGSVRVSKYSEFIRNLVVPTNLNLIHMKPLRGTALMVFDPGLVFLLVDNLFGGDGRFHTRVEGRDFTQTEQRIILRILDIVFEAYTKSWEPVYPVEFEYIRSEMNTQFANIATPRPRFRGLHQPRGAGVPGGVRVPPPRAEYAFPEHRHAERGGGGVDLHGGAGLGARPDPLLAALLDARADPRFADLAPAGR